MKLPCSFTMDLDVWDIDELLAAAKTRAAEDGLTPEGADEILLKDGKPDVTACLIMLLDPGSLAGSDISNSYVECHTYLQRED